MMKVTEAFIYYLSTTLKLLTKIYAFYESQEHAFSTVEEGLVTNHSFSISFLVLTVKTYPQSCLLKDGKALDLKTQQKPVCI